MWPQRTTTTGLAVAVAMALVGHVLPGLAQEPMRTVRGEVTYLQRIALPADSLVVVELRDADEAVVGEVRVPTEGRQVPLAFSVQGPVGVPLTFQGAIYSDGHPAWISEPIAIDAGADPVQLGAVRVQPYTSMGFASSLRCGATEILVGFVDQDVRLEIGGRTLTLEPVPAASGARFELADDPSTFFWSRGNRALVSIQGDLLPECVSADAAPASLRARGNEPGWQLTIEDDRLRFETDYGDTWLETPAPEGEDVDGGVTYAVPAFGFAATVRAEVCRDDMTGMPYPETVLLTLADRSLRGCGGFPRDLLLGDEWVVEDVAGGGAVDRSRVTLGFDAAGRLAGSGGCNRYTTSYQLTGEGLTIGQAAATMMACSEALMDQEQRFFAALAATTRFDVDATGALILYGPQIPMLTARR